MWKHGSQSPRQHWQRPKPSSIHPRGTVKYSLFKFFCIFKLLNCVEYFWLLSCVVYRFSDRLWKEAPIKNVRKSNNCEWVGLLLASFIVRFSCDGHSTSSSTWRRRRRVGCECVCVHDLSSAIVSVKNSRVVLDAVYPGISLAFCYISLPGQVSCVFVRGSRYNSL